MAMPTNIFINDISMPEAVVAVRDVESESERQKREGKKEQAFKGLVTITMDAARKEAMRSLRQANGDVTFRTDLGNERIELKCGRITQVRSDGEGKIKVILTVPFVSEKA